MSWGALSVAAGLVLAGVAPAAHAVSRVSTDALGGTTAETPSVSLGADAVSAWEVARSGIQVEGTGFGPGAAVTASIDGVDGGQFTADEQGRVSLTLTVELSSGTHTVALVSGDQSASALFEIVPDEEFYADEIGAYEDAYAWASRRVVTESELAEAPVELIGRELPAGSSVELRVDDETVDVLTSNSIGRVDGLLSAPLAIGEHAVSFVHPAASVSVLLDVVSDAQGDPAPAGVYEGESWTTRVGGRDYADISPDPWRFPVELEIGEDGELSRFSTQFWWACRENALTGTSDFVLPDAGAPTVGQPFEIRWGDAGFDYTLFGVIGADGEASGYGQADHGACGVHEFAWTASTEVGPAPDPEPTQAPTPDPEPTPTPDPEPTQAPTPDPEPTQAPEPEPTGEPGDPNGQIPQETPSRDALPDDLQGAIVAPATAQEGATIRVGVGAEIAGQRMGVWLFSDPAYLGAHTPAADGTARVTLPGGTTGEHVIAAYAADGSPIGWTTISIVPAGVDPDGELAPTGESPLPAVLALAGALVVGSSAVVIGSLRRSRSRSARV
ncbi:hypothetical protein N8K70_07710 [Microbacterium betulae]|uniref:Bacterial Ig-like domain-containing protein n=1 Tax=Microbacterium betulae TaxID=2981139 RepID=A0AA97FKF7_9MICO|nr:hypothetical protein [Microbacterium sp. AB]WOF24536.1 hypothetical protein N8K70_07710 [Microbacterium sp. AB]